MNMSVDADSQRLSPLSPALPKPNTEQLYWGRLYGSSKALAISRLARQRKGMTLVICADSLNANRMVEELRFYLDADMPIVNLPDWETLPYDLFSPYQDIISERLATLARLPHLHSGILVVPITSIMHRMLPVDYLQKHSLLLKAGDTLNQDQFRHKLKDSGYVITPQVMEHGEASIRGSIIDIFPMGCEHPLRIDLFDDEIESIREFDTETQRSLEKQDSIAILPAREIALNDEGIAHFRSAFRERFEGNSNECPVYRDVSQGLAPNGIEYYLPLFFDETSSLFDYLPDDALLFIDDDVRETMESFWSDIGERYEQHRYDVERPILKPEEMFFNEQEMFRRFKLFSRIWLTAMEQEDKAGSSNYLSTLPPQVTIDARASKPLQLLQTFLHNFSGRVLIVAESIGRRETLLELFREHELNPILIKDWHAFMDGNDAFALTVAPLDRGLLLKNPDIAVICESQLFGERVMQRRLRKRKSQDSDAIIRNLTELTDGAPVVHEDNGVGRYRGLVTLTVGDIPAEYIMLEYANEDKLYVPVASLHLVSRYTGADPESAPLHRLGSGQWEKARRKAAEKVYDVAAELLELHAQRAAREGHSFNLEHDAYRAFAQGFPFEETPGQLDAIEAVMADMQASTPMDRLVCGDAGFGKTEVAMRAAFLAIQNNKQVAILVPTTLLAQQHYQNFKDRFAEWPVRVELISRFRTGKEQNTVVDGLENGKVDIVIGTHKLIQGTIKYKNLGLVIIDEEHRFGVRQKEKFKAIRAEIDVLTLTATPIPRTLNMALSSLRELSIISTPPSRRLAVKTFVREWKDGLIKEAIMRELKRGGQVYFLHNRVETIDKAAKTIQDLMPEARVKTAHGQMAEKELEQIMLDFYHRRFNVLVSTTIIETGIDVPSANTIIIDRADKFGLAQLYQLRGRVGRSHHRAYAYLIVPDRKSITKDAVKRLEAIESLEDLGIGFTLATHDLEIRGSGEILGEEQSGQIQEVGFGMYMDLLERAVEALKSGKQPELDRTLDHGAEINLNLPCLIPEDFMPDVHQRLIFYKRIASAKDTDELQELQEELIDRFGLLPEPVRNLFQLTELKLFANPIGIRKIDLGAEGGRVQFGEQARIDPGRIIQLIQTQPHFYKLDGQDKLRIIKDIPEAEDRFQLLEDLMKTIALEEVA